MTSWFQEGCTGLQRQYLDFCDNDRSFVGWSSPMSARIIKADVNRLFEIDQNHRRYPNRRPAHVRRFEKIMEQSRRRRLSQGRWRLTYPARRSMPPKRDYWLTTWNV